jgi:hypothetical protein
MNKQRKEAEELIYKIFDTVDSTHTNSDYYKKLFSNMSDKDFEKFCSRRLPFRFHIKVFEVEPKMYDIVEAVKVLNKPLMEKVKLPYVYMNKKGEPVETAECLVLYIHLKRMKQMLTKKNHTSIHNENRNTRTGLLLGGDKGGKETDREFESLATMGLDNTIKELARPRADSMESKSQMSAAILSKGYVEDSDLFIAKNDSIAKNLLNAYLIGAHIHSNLIDINYMTPLTASNSKLTQKRKNN